MKTDQNNASSANKGFLIALISAMTLAFTGILIRLISDNYQLPALVIAFWRDAFVVICALPFFLVINPKLIVVKKSDIPFLILFGAVLAVFNITWTLAVTLTGAAVATVLVYSSAGFTAVLGWLFLNEQLGLKKSLAVILCLGGCVLVSGATQAQAWQTNPIGILSGLLSGLLYALYSLMGRRGSQKSINPWTILLYAFLFAAFFLLLINLLPIGFIPGKALRPADLFQLRNEWRGWLLLLILAAGPTLVGFGLYNVSLGLLPSSTANLILTTEPVLTALIAYFMLGERFTIQEVIGAGLIITALVLIRVRAKHQFSHKFSN